MSFFELFQPGLRHLREERDRQKSVVANPKHGGSGGPLGIDLSGGTARFAMPARPDTGEEETSADEDGEADPSAEGAHASTEDYPGPAEEPAGKGEDASG
jgi:hypothetical protein